MPLFDPVVLACLTLVVIFTLISGLDDLILDLAMISGWVHRKFLQLMELPPFEQSTRCAPEKRIAIMVPLWQEHRVIGKMLEHNIAAIRYTNYDFFVGVYPNDVFTVEAVTEAEKRYPRLHRVTCPHDGPTSKGDCLNWIYQGILLYEQETGAHFDVALTHDAEDLIHPESLGVINRYTDKFDMVQIPVLPLPTPFWQLTHGVYCDEFAEFQTKDIFVRQMLGGFVPSNGVGTGYTRKALHALAGSAANRVFEPGCLTEDYENGLRLHQLGLSQIFVPIRFANGHPVATREYFPQSFRSAVKQRTRWIIGIALQTWERHGWRGSVPTVYWFWRDRKGLLGNPVSLLANCIFLYGLCTWLWCHVCGIPWGLKAAILHPVLTRLLSFTFAMQFVRTSVRMFCSGRIYGWLFSVGVPIRTLWANAVNSLATLLAIWRYATTRLRRKPLVWLKTEHFYPSRQALMRHKRKLGEVLVTHGYLSPEHLPLALSSQPQGTRLGEHLIRLGLLTEEQLYEALSLQQNVTLCRIDPVSVRRDVARSLPVKYISRWRVFPVQVVDGCLSLAGPELPAEELEDKLRSFTRLELRFHLITPGNFQQLERALL
jgi:adsorption protein B